jgi:hypothetical protein
MENVKRADRASDARCLEMYNLHLQGCSNKELALRYKCTPHSANQWVNRGARLHMGNPTWIAGLEARAANALMRAKFTSRDDVRKAMVSGTLKHVKDMGRKSIEAVWEWFEKIDAEQAMQPTPDPKIDQRKNYPEPSAAPIGANKAESQLQLGIEEFRACDGRLFQTARERDLHDKYLKLMAQAADFHTSPLCQLQNNAKYLDLVIKLVWGWEEWKAQRS